MSDNGVFNSFSTNRGTFGTTEFLESNSLVAKLAFLLLVIFVFVLLLSLILIQCHLNALVFSICLSF